MANEQALNQQLQALQDRAEQQHNLAESSRELLYRNLAETYFWWRKAQLEDGYLDRISPLDFVELFTMLAQAQTVADTIIIRGNEFVMNVSYETATARHEAFIPTLDAKGFRNDELFARYNNA